MKRTLKQVLPAPLFAWLLRTYHLSMALGSAVLYGFPSRKLIVIGVTGTKGKSSTTEMIAAICKAHGHSVATLNSILIRIGDDVQPNTMRMSMPGRAFIQRFLARAVAAHCDIAVLEMTSEGSRQYRHRGIALDALVFTNLAPEHIESHGSFEAYADAKYELGMQLVRSSKRPRIMVANADDPQGARFLSLPVEYPLPFSVAADPTHASSDTGGHFRVGETEVAIALPGEFSIANALAAATVCRALGMAETTIARGLAAVQRIPGRAESIDEGQQFTVIVDYAHTPDSLQALFAAYAQRRTICIIGSTGGGRDTWNRPVKGKVASEMCDEVIIANEDPYDEDPASVVEQIRAGAVGPTTPHIILDRREAIRAALTLARPGDAVLITGKGTDPTIQGPRGTSVPWSDAQVVREELHTLGLARA